MNHPENTLRLPKWWYILPLYLTLWTIGFSLFNLIDGNGMMHSFGIDTGGASDFIMLNSAGRYVAIAVAMILGIWIFKTFSSTLTALVTRLCMDVLDLGIGLKTGVIENFTGVAQSCLMFLIPGIISIWWLIKFNRSQS